MHTRAQRGNILFLILLAVVLFAALSYAVTQSTRGGGNDASKESVKTKAASITQFFDQMDAAILRMKLTEGIPIEKISFEYLMKSYSGSQFNNWANPNCSTDSCRLFKPSGGGVAPRTFEPYAVATPTGWQASWSAPGYMDFFTLQWPYAGTDAHDIIIRVLALEPPICTEINASLGITAVPWFSGSETDASNPANWDTSTRVIAGNASQLLGKNTFAIFSGNYCTIYHVLFIR